VWLNQPLHLIGAGRACFSLKCLYTGYFKCFFHRTERCKHWGQYRVEKRNLNCASTILGWRVILKIYKPLSSLQ
jgi:hypothetical protein